MTVLSNWSALVPVDAVGQPPLAFVRALKAYRLATGGLYTRSIRQLEHAAATLKAGDGTPAYYARALGLLGLVARADGNWSEAEHRLSDAVDRLVSAGAHAEAALLLALRLEALCCIGRVEDARRALDVWARRGEPTLIELGNGVVHLARGAYSEARQLLGTAPKVGLSGAWQRLFLAECDLDEGRPNQALPLLAEVLTEARKEGRFDESVVRALVLEARARLERLWGGVTSIAQQDRVAVWAAIKQAQRYAVNFERYRAGVMVLAAQLATAEGRPDAAARFDAAASALDACGAQLDLGRALARQVTLRLGQTKDPVQPILARGRDLLSRAQADARAKALTKAEGTVGGQSVMASRSILQRSVMELASDDHLELEALFEVNHALATTLDLEELLTLILDEGMKVLKANRGALLRRNPDGTLTCAVGRGVVPERVREGENELSFSVIQEVERTGQTLLTDNAQVDSRLRGQASVMATDIRSVLCAPLKTKAGVYGYLYLDSTVKTRIFTEAHRNLLSVFATQAAISIENASALAELDELSKGLERRVAERTQELSLANEKLTKTIEDLTQTRMKLLEAEKQALEKEMNLARRIQEGIVPERSLIVSPGVSFIGWVEPATQVGGDFWTWLKLDQDQTLLLLGDVTGHGVGAGMLTTVAKACCDTLVRQSAVLAPEALLATLSDVLFHSAKGDLRMTAIALVVDPKARTLTFANAGHPSPIYVAAGAGLPQLVSFARGASRPLGEALGATYAPSTKVYESGDRLVGFTDGVVECTNAQGRRYGIKRLSEVAVANARKPLAEHLSACLDDAHQFFGTVPHEDDVTLVVAEFS